MQALQASENFIQKICTANNAFLELTCKTVNKIQKYNFVTKHVVKGNTHVPNDDTFKEISCLLMDTQVLS